MRETARKALKKKKEREQEREADRETESEHMFPNLDEFALNVCVCVL